MPLPAIPISRIIQLLKFIKTDENESKPTCESGVDVDCDQDVKAKTENVIKENNITKDALDLIAPVPSLIIPRLYGMPPIRVKIIED